MSARREGERLFAAAGFCSNLVQQLSQVILAYPRQSLAWLIPANRVGGKDRGNDAGNILPHLSNLDQLICR
jgi:hypothetical protein